MFNSPIKYHYVSSCSSYIYIFWAQYSHKFIFPYYKSKVMLFTWYIYYHGKQSAYHSLMVVAAACPAFFANAWGVCSIARNPKTELDPQCTAGSTFLSWQTRWTGSSKWPTKFRDRIHHDVWVAQFGSWLHTGRLNLLSSLCGEVNKI